MRVALHATTEVGTRTGRILLAEPALIALGLYGQTGRTEDRRTMAIDSLDGFDLLVTDDPAPAPLAALALEAGIPLVAAHRPRGRSLPRRFGDRGLTLLAPADLADGIAASLAAHETARRRDPESVVIAWTEEGRGRRRGVAVPFPDPVGPRWAYRRRPFRGRGDGGVHLVAPVPGPWAGALARVEGGGTEVIVGVADHGAHLSAIALAAGVIAVIEGAYHAGACRPAAAAPAFLTAALRIGLGVATFSAGD